MSLMTLPLRAENERDTILVMLVAPFLTRNEVMDISAFPAAFRLLATLEQYIQDADLDQLARIFDIEPRTVEIYEMQAQWASKDP